jgi:hypothetical protein
MVSIEDSLCVYLPDSQLPVFLHPVQIVSGHKFVKVAKGDHKVIRLLSNQSSSCSRGLTKTTVIEDLIALRNQKRQELLHRRPEENQRRESLGIDSPAPKRSKVSEASLPTIVELEVPAIGDAGSTSMRVLMAKPGTPLFIEATNSNIDYLRAAVAAQIPLGEHSGCDGEQQRETNSSTENGAHWDSSEQVAVPNAGPGISFVKVRQAYRVRYKEDGQVKWKDFRSASLEAHDLFEASQKAKAFQQTVQ